MNKRNYSRELEKIISVSKDRRPKVMLHSCCGPCSSSVLEFLTQFFDVTLFWYNPNLYPEEEFQKRLNTQLELIQKMGLAGRVNVKICPWDSAEYYTRVSGLEDEKEGGARCKACFALRLEKCAQAAAEAGCDYFCSTLTVSRYKNAELINQIGEQVASVYGVKWLPSDFKKNNGENRSVELSELYDLYRQQYCGCEFSLRARKAFEAANDVEQKYNES